MKKAVPSYTGYVSQDFNTLVTELASYTFREPHELHTLFEKLLKDLHAEEGLCKGKLEAGAENARDDAKRFYEVAEMYLASLESLYRRHGLKEAEGRAHHAKMEFRHRGARSLKRRLAHIGYALLQGTTDYGHSVTRWMLTIGALILFFTALYWGFPHVMGMPSITDVTGSLTTFDYFYFSLSTFTTLGYGDIIPASEFVKIAAGLEAMFGYLMLGTGIALIERRL